MDRGRGHKYKLVRKQSRTRLRQSFFSNRVVSHWNCFPEVVVTSESLTSFKNQLDKLYMIRDLVYKDTWA